MTARDYLADLEQHLADASLDGPGLTSETLGALLGIGQQLRRIADQWEQPLEPVTAVLAETTTSDLWCVECGAWHGHDVTCSAHDADPRVGF